MMAMVIWGPEKYNLHADGAGMLVVWSKGSPERKLGVVSAKKHCIQTKYAEGRRSVVKAYVVHVPKMAAAAAMEQGTRGRWHSRSFGTLHSGEKYATAADPEERADCGHRHVIWF